MAAAPALLGLAPASAVAASAAPLARVRPGDPLWPGPDAWDGLRRATGGRLLRVASPIAACTGPADAACAEAFRELKNPYATRDHAGLTQTTGWVDAWTAQPSVYAVAARDAADVAAAVRFARDHNLRLVIKGTGHSYLGASNAPDSLLVWTRAMDRIEVHDAFTPDGSTETVPAVSVGGGAIWMHVYQAVTTGAGRYVQGGGCGTVGVAGLVQGGGFGSYSKAYGTAGASLLEAEIVTADGAVRVVNAVRDPELFWALRGGGAGTFGVITRLTLRTHDLPPQFGIVTGTIAAASDEAFRRLISRFVDLCAERLITPHWGNVATLRPRRRRLDIGLEFQGLERAEAEAIWRPFLDWVAASPADFALDPAPRVLSIEARRRWDQAFIEAHVPEALIADDRPGAPPENVFWSANYSEAGHFLHGFESAWLPAALLQADARVALADALHEAAKLWSVELHFQKGLAGATDAVRATVRDTPINPDVLDAFALAIIAGEGPPAMPGVAGHEPNLAVARRDATRIAAAMAALRRVAPATGAYVAESGYFQPDWQRAFWGAHYERLRAVKAQYDPDGLFFVHHGVGSEQWSADGFQRLA
jgi:FAD/FMN-containing dehydrogenase